MPASAFRHPVSQSGSGAFLYRNEIPYSSAENLVPASAFLFIPDHTDWMPDSPTFRHLKRDTPCRSILLVLVVVKVIPMQCTSKLQVVKSSKVRHLALS